MEENYQSTIDADLKSEARDGVPIMGGPLSALEDYIAGLGDVTEPSVPSAEAILEAPELTAHNDWVRYASSSQLRISEGMNARSNFKNTSLSPDQFVAKLTRHRVAAAKDARAFAAYLRDDRPAESGKNVSDANIAGVSGLPYDIDGTQQPWEATRVLKAEGIAHAVYSSWSHTKQVPKFRVVVFLKEPCGINNDDDRRMHSATYNALGERWGMKHDRACSNVSRLFYYPAHDGKVVPFASFSPGRPVDYLAAVEHVRASARDNHAAEAKQGEAKTPLKTRNLLRFNTTCRGLFEIEDFVAAKDPDGIRQRRPRDGGIHCRCPNDDGLVTGRPHTDQSPASTSFRVVSASNNTHGTGYSINCLTDGCSQHFKDDALLFLDAMCDRYKVTDGEELIAYCSDPAEARLLWDGWKGLGSRHSVTRTLSITADQIEEKAVIWLWQDWIALRAATLAVGQTKIGKSQLGIHLLARVSDGLPFTTGSRGRVGREREREPVRGVLVTAEDPENEVVVPRLKAAGADLSRIDIVRGYEEAFADGKIEKRPFTIEKSIEALTDLLQSKPDIRLIIIDPVNAYLGANVDSHRNNQTRAVLQPLKELAERFNVAIVLIHHMRKGAKGNGSVTDMSGGSNAFVEATRAVIMLAREPGDAGRCIMQMEACNYARSGDGLVYEVEEAYTAQGNRTSRFNILEGEKPAVTVEQALSDNEGDDRNAALDAKQYLIGLLGGGAEVEATAIKKQAEKEGFAWATVRRAKGPLGVVAKRRGFGPDGSWVWYLPPEIAKEAARAVQVEAACSVLATT